MIITLRDAVDRLGIPLRRSSQYQGFMDCPLCGGKGKVTLNFSKNIYNCPRCTDFHGNAIDFWAFFRGINESTREETREKAWRDIVHDSYNASSINFIKKRKRKSVTNASLMELNKRDFVMELFLKNIPLKKEHYDDLKRRGMSSGSIIRNGYKSVPDKKTATDAVKKIKKEYGIKSFIGIPGFYKDDQFVKTCSGYLIPMRDVRGRIQGFQIRKDDPNDGAKYVFLTSAWKENGTKCEAFSHFVCSDYSKPCKSLIITEGPLKADLIHEFTGIPVVAVPGVNSQAHLKKMIAGLVKQGLEKVYIAFDMDYLTNKHVKKALNNLNKMLSGFNLEYTQVKWKKEYKGLDDYLLFKRREKIS